MKHLVVTECFDSIPISDTEKDALTSVEVEELITYIHANELDEANIIISRHHVTFINYVGFLQLSSCSIEILPKVTGGDVGLSRKVLLRMLACTGYLDIYESELSSLSLDKHNLFEIYGYLFASRLYRELTKGPHYNYMTVQENLQRVRGKINMRAQLVHSARKSASACCIYDEFQINNPLNQLFKAVLVQLVYRVNHMRTRNLISHCLLILDEVERVPGSRLLEQPVHFNRMNKRFYPCYVLARMLLNQTATIPNPGFHKGVSILFKMNELFEAYIAYLAKKVANDVIVKDTRYKLLVNNNSGRGAFQLEPDLFLSLENNRNLIIDTKWKILHSSKSRHGVKREDFYQMYAYLTRYKEVETVILLYPHHPLIGSESGQCLESWSLEENPNKQLKVFSISYEDEARAKEDLTRMIFEHSSSPL
jgi:5-methylcytosine-specific restriction enzyme subunit McrC